MKKIVHLVEYILMFLLIIEANSIYTDQFGTSKIRFLIIAIMGVLVLLNSVQLVVTRNVIKKVLTFYILYFISLVSLVLMHSDFDNKFILNYFVALPLGVLLVVVYLIKFNFLVLVEKFNNIVLLLAIISLFFWIFGSVLQFLSPTNYILSNWAENRIDSSYYGIYYETQRILVFDNVFIRNTGMFPESPMWSFPLCLALINEHYLVKKSSNIKKMILSLTILTTFSTTGIFVAGLIYIYKLIYKYKGKYKVFFLTIVSTIIGFLAIVLREKSKTGSASLRYDDFEIGLSIWKENIFFGVGGSFSAAITSRMEASTRGLGYSNGLFVVLVTGGIILFLISFSWLVYFMVSRIKLDYKFIGLLILFLIFNTIVSETILFLFICAIGYGIVLAGDYRGMDIEVSRSV